MKKLQNIGENVNENGRCVALCLGIVALKSDFCNLDIPVAEYVPAEIVELLNCDTELEFVKVIGNLFCKVINL